MIIPYNIRRPFIWLRDLPREIRWFIQRGKRGYADCDLWSFDNYLANMLPKALRQFKERLYAYPATDGAETPEKWNSILDQMIEGFEAIRDNDDDFIRPGENDGTAYIERYHVAQSKLDHSMQLMSKWFTSLWW